MHGEQHIAREDEGYGHDPGLALIFFKQKVGTQMQVAIVSFVVTRRCLDVLDLVFIRQSHTENTADPVALLVAGIGQVEPDRRDAGQILARVDRNLIEPTVLQDEYIDHKFS